ncbi:endothelin-converting enzyme 1-like isoform X5 [Mya arenaria]|uniref:endothelin-converting enzyme 1-like isoform X5 n=1 Tax=Mya arenaria TaxID=6604 RepID=UPI0022DFAACF|nr:endothelin-converting enzyme 1-like isoform X5 [Mya arenaria]
MATDGIEMTTCIEESEPLNENGRANIKGNKNSDYSESARGLIKHFKNSTYNTISGASRGEMQESPYADNRWGSEDDMLEYEDGPLCTCGPCKRRRALTGPEKGLIVLALVAFVVIIVLAAHMGGKDEVKVPPKCESPGCLSAASSILSAMDPSADPCEDFHQYACGGWLRETPIPPGYPMWDRFQELAYKNWFMLKTFIETHKMDGGAQKKVRDFYRSCMAESQVSRAETLSEFRSLLTNVTSGGGAGALPGAGTTHQKWDMTGTLLSIHKLNTWPLFQVMIGPDERNPNVNIIKIEAGHSPFPYNIFKQEAERALNERSSNNTDSVNGTDPDATSQPQVNGTKIEMTDNKTDSTNPEYNIDTTDTPEPTTTKKAHIKDTHPHPTENVTELVRDYLRETTELLQALWDQTKEQAEKEAQNILELEKQLSLAHDIELHIHNRTQAYNAMAVKDLQSKCTMINWSSYINSLLSAGSEAVPVVNPETEVIVLHEKALEQVCDIVHEYSSNDEKKSILERYVLLGLARSMKPFFDLTTFQPDVNHDEEMEAEGEHWRRCTFYTNKALGLATAAVYVNATTIDASLAQITTLVTYVKRAFKEYLLRKIWMDTKTRENAEKKLDEMIEKVSYPSFILNNTFLSEFYTNFTIGNNWFNNLLKWRRFTITNMVNSLSKPFDRLNSWINPPVTVESDYSPVRNDIIFPIALFHLPIYSHEGPSALNFGAIGSIIGHEITHAFDIQGRQYDGQGRLRDWWDPVTAEMFNETTHCMKDQYDHFKIGNMTIHGAQTLEENIADNGGLRAAHIAYELWMKEHGEEEPVAGLDLDARQLFFVSYAQLYCSKWTMSGVTDFLMRDAHSPGPYRIEGALSNSLAFPDVFKCSYVAKYNPPTKCRVW